MYRCYRSSIDKSIFPSKCVCYQTYIIQPSYLSIFKYADACVSTTKKLVFTALKAARDDVLNIDGARQSDRFFDK